MLYTATPNLRKLHIVKNVFVYLVTECSDCGILTFDHNWFTLVWHFPTWFSLHPNQVQTVPDHLFESVKIPFELGRDWTHVLCLAQEV